MFADGNKGLGLVALKIAGLALANIGILIVVDRFGFNVFGFQFMAVLSLPVILVAIWVLSVMNFIKKKKQNK